MEITNIKILVISLILSFVASCNNKRNSVNETYYEGTEQLKEQRIYQLSKDTSSYEYTSFYRNGRIKEKGNVVNSQKEGVWQEWYGDGVSRGEIEYIHGDPNVVKRDRKLPEVLLNTDSLKIGSLVKMKVINLYPQDLYGSNINIHPLPDEELNYDAAFIVPENVDTVLIYYKDVLGIRRRQKEKKIKPSEITDPSKYGMTKKQLKELKERGREITIIEESNPVIIIGKFPVCKE